MSITLGLDPGYGRMGFAVVEAKGSQLRALEYGVIETAAGMAFEDRLLAVFDGVTGLAKRYKIDEAAVETLFFSKNTKTAMAVAEARGVLRLALVQAGIPVIELSPGAVKVALAGDGKADKGQITRMVTRLLNLPGPPKPDDAADAVALALTALRTANVRRMTAIAQKSKKAK